MCAPLFDVNQLGDWKDRLASLPLTAGVPVESRDSAALFTMKTTWRGKFTVAKVALRMLQNKLFGQNLRGAGNALMGRLFKIAIDRGVEVWPECPVKDFLVEQGRVVGVLAERNGQTIELRATLGVLINAGGFAQNQAMRERYLPKPTSTDWTASMPGDTGEII